MHIFTNPVIFMHCTERFIRVFYYNSLQVFLDSISPFFLHCIMSIQLVLLNVLLEYFVYSITYFFDSISPFPALLHEYANSSKWNEAIRLCRFVKVCLHVNKLMLKHNTVELVRLLPTLGRQWFKVTSTS